MEGNLKAALQNIDFTFETNMIPIDFQSIKIDYEQNIIYEIFQKQTLLSYQNQFSFAISSIFYHS